MMNYRNKKLLNDARGQSCKHCGINDGTVVNAHSNWYEHGKGASIKAHDYYTAHLCYSCHAWLDQGKASREEKRDMWYRAFERTLDWRFENGILEVVK